MHRFGDKSCACSVINQSPELLSLSSMPQYNFQRCRHQLMNDWHETNFIGNCFRHSDPIRIIVSETALFSESELVTDRYVTRNIIVTKNYLL